MPAPGSVGAALTLGLTRSQLATARGLLGSGAAGLFLLVGEAMLIGTRTAFWTGENPGIGAGGFVTAAGITGLGKGRGDAFMTGFVGAIVALVVVFVFYPLTFILVNAFELKGGAGFGAVEFFPRFFSSSVWGTGCLTGQGYCGPAINSFVLGLSIATGTTVTGLAFALIFTRTAFPAKMLLRVISVLPIITPPFVIGLALILLFGRAGAITEFFPRPSAGEKTACSTASPASGSRRC